MRESSRLVLPSAVSSRRNFVRLAALGSGAALLGLAAPRRLAAAEPVEAVLLSCMDYRLLDEIGRYMDGRGFTNRYDHLILAGASLGALTEAYPDWGSTFWEHISVAIALHRVQRLLVMDHRDCGAYKVLLGEAHLASAASETAEHAEQLRALRSQVATRHPALPTELLLMALDGSVEAIA